MERPSIVSERQDRSPEFGLPGRHGDGIGGNSFWTSMGFRAGSAMSSSVNNQSILSRTQGYPDGQDGHEEVGMTDGGVAPDMRDDDQQSQQTQQTAQESQNGQTVSVDSAVATAATDQTPDAQTAQAPDAVEPVATADAVETAAQPADQKAQPTAQMTDQTESATDTNHTDIADVSEASEASEASESTGQYDQYDSYSDSGSLDMDDDRPDMSEMQRLLDEQDAQFRTIKRGDVVEGQIVRIDQDEILVDIGLKSEGVLSTKELPSQGYGSLAELHVGDDVLVYIMQPETAEGHAVVSIRRARQERQWRIAQEQFERGELQEAEVIDHNKGGLIVNLEGIRGFVPISQILNLRREDSADNTETQSKLQAMVGRKLQLKIIEINRNRNRLILSERQAVQEWRARRREELLNELQVGEVRQGVVSNLANFGAFVDLGGADGLVHISQLAWSRVNHPSEVLKVGQKVEVQVLSVDREKKKIALSIKRAEVDPWSQVEQRYHVGQLVTGTVTKIAPFGAFARIEDGVEGLVHLSEMPIGTQDPKQALHEGQDITVRILRIDPERRRLGLSLRAVDETDGVTGATETGATAGEPAAEAGAPAATPTDAMAATPAPARQPQQQRPAPQRQEAPTTAMAAAFAAAQANQERDQSESDAQTSAPTTPADSAETAETTTAIQPTPPVQEPAPASDSAATPAPESATPATSGTAPAEAEMAAPATTASDVAPDATSDATSDATTTDGAAAAQTIEATPAEEAAAAEADDATADATAAAKTTPGSAE